MWVVVAHDSITSSRMRRHGTAKGMVAQIRATALLGMLLAFSYLAGMQYVPKEYYVDSLEEIRIKMLNSDMSITPTLLRKAIDLIPR